MSNQNKHPNHNSDPIQAQTNGNPITNLDIAWLVILFLACFIAYWPSLTGPFVFDDLHNIFYNTPLQITNLSPETLWQAAFSNPDFFRPLPMASFGVNHYLHGLDTQGFHLVNISIHFLAGVFLFLFIRKTFSLPAFGQYRKNAAHLAAFSALLWLVHPIQTQSVAYIVQRMNSMAGMFFILSLLFYAYGRTTPDKRRSLLLLTLSAVAALCAFVSKENALVLPLVIILFEWFFIRDLSTEWLLRHWWKIAIGAGAFALLIWIVIGDDILHWIGNGYDIRRFTLMERVFTEWRVVVWYLSLMLLPLTSRMNLIHDFSVSQSLFSNWQTLPALGLITVFMVLAFALAKKHRLISFALLWFFITLFMESSFIGLELVFEHRLYIPSMMLGILPVLMMFRLIKQPVLAAIPLLCLAMALSYATYERNLLWGDGIKLMEDCVAKNPGARSHYNLAHTLFLKGELQRSIDQYEMGLLGDRQTLENEPDMQESRKQHIQNRMAEAHSTRAAILYGAGDYNAAMQGYLKALLLMPDYDLALNNLGLILAKTGNISEAVQYYTKALDANPDRADTLANLGDAQSALGNLEQAVSWYSQSLALSPSTAWVHANLARVLVNQGDFQKGVDHLMEALALNPEDQESQNALLTVLKILNEIERLEDAIKAQPNNAVYYFQLAKLWEQHKKLEQAVRLCEQGLALAPGYPIGLNQLGQIRMDQGRFEEAEGLLKQTAQLLEENIPSLYNLACLYARQGNTDQAVEYLKAAVDKGFNAWDLLRTDPDMANIRDTEYYLSHARNG
ncbi:MAG: tetratricopeptide repeat protein [Desulfatibacillum sp.]|nr:tetratricopeptide repeat protein [Desulfatibacillum sp.]